MMFIVLVVVLIALAVLSVRFGADSRDDFPPFGVTKPRRSRW